jgi:hypothetical protein
LVGRQRLGTLKSAIIFGLICHELGVTEVQTGWGV